MDRQIRIIKTDKTGHTATEATTEELRDYRWDSRKEAVVINGAQVNTFEDFMRAVDEHGPNEIPEVWMFPPMAGG